MQNLAERHKQTVLLDLAVAQKNLAAASQGTRIGCFSRRLKVTFQFPLHHTLGPAGLGNDLIGLNVTEFYGCAERRILRLRLHHTMSADFTAAGLRENIGKVQLLWIVMKGRLQMLEEETISKRHFRYFGSAPQCYGITQT